MNHAMVPHQTLLAKALRTLWQTPEPVTYQGQFIRLNGAIC